jgi:hypothetical protein
MSVSLVENGAALQSMRNSDFDVYSAYGEVLDNSIQANAQNIKINMVFKVRNSASRSEPIDKIAFGDDGDGMPEDVLHRCLQLGYSSRFNDRTGIGRFGVGATLAAINQCKKIELYSSEGKSKWFYTYIDLDLISAKPSKMTEIPLPVETPLPPEFANLVGATNGTLVIWSKYDRQPAEASEILREMKVWMGRTYRKYIWGGLGISVNGEQVKAVDPLYLTTEKTKFPDDPKGEEYQPITVPWPIPLEDRLSGGPTYSDIVIKMSLLPEKLRPHQGTGNSSETAARHIDQNNGISIMRNNREVYYDTIPHWPGAKFQEIDRWWGCEISFDPILDKEFTVKNIKRGALPVKALKQTLSDKIEPTRNTALETVRELWAKVKADSIVSNTEEGTVSGHEDAEDAASKTATPKNRIDKGKDLDVESAKAAEDWLKDQDERQKAAWQTKFQTQPYTIMDAEWKGPEFVETNHLGGHDVLRYNMRHTFFAEIDNIRKKLAEREDDADARRLKTLIDLLLLSYAKAEAMIEPDYRGAPESLLETLRMNWGNYLKNYLETYNETNPIQRTETGKK